MPTKIIRVEEKDGIHQPATVEWTRSLLPPWIPPATQRATDAGYVDFGYDPGSDARLKQRAKNKLTRPSQQSGSAFQPKPAFVPGYKSQITRFFNPVPRSQCTGVSLTNDVSLDVPMATAMSDEVFNQLADMASAMQVAHERGSSAASSSLADKSPSEENAVPQRDDRNGQHGQSNMPSTAVSEEVLTSSNHVMTVGLEHNHLGDVWLGNHHQHPPSVVSNLASVIAEQEAPLGTTEGGVFLHSESDPCTDRQGLEDKRKYGQLPVLRTADSSKLQCLVSSSKVSDIGVRCSSSGSSNSSSSSSSSRSSCNRSSRSQCNGNQQ